MGSDRYVWDVEPCMRPFPTYEDVFDVVTNEIRELYLPALSIEARAVNPEWTGLLHFVMTVEPHDGGLGEYSGETYENYFCRHNLFGFRRLEDQRYQPLADPMFFAINCARRGAGPLFTSGHLSAKETLEELSEHYADVHASFAESQQRFLNSGKLLDRRNKHSPWFLQLGGVPDGLGLTEFPAERVSDGFPLSPDGRRFGFVGKLNAYPFRSASADGFYMFYDPVDEIVWFSLNFS